jgi:16S rRNA (uracil1498-N3)-methyltransferase
MAQLEVYYTPPDLIDLKAGRAVLAEDETHHLVRVRRTRPGDSIVLIDGVGTSWEAKVLSTDGKKSTLQLGEAREDWREPLVHISLGLGILKSNQFELAVNHCVQAGVGEITPLKTRYTVAKWAKYRHDRSRRIATTAAKQCGRGLIPPLREEQPLQPWCIQQAAKDVKLVLDPDGMPFPRLKEGQSVALAIGPEGGFSEEEVETCLDSGFEKVSLGQRRLRAEVAALTAVSLAALPVES